VATHLRLVADTDCDRRTYRRVGLIGWYVSSFIVKPNQLVRERPFIEHNIEMTRRAYALDRIEPHAFPGRYRRRCAGCRQQSDHARQHPAVGLAALQDTLRQIQEIRTYYDFPDIDIDRYSGGSVRQMMLATRELNVDKLPESSRNWINEKADLHPRLRRHDESGQWLHARRPADAGAEQHADPEHIAGPQVTRPEIYFGELTNTDVYVKTRQKEFNYPQGDSNNLNSYEGSGGIRLGGFLRRTLIAYDRGDITKLPFSDDVTPDSRLLMRRTLRERVQELAPFLTWTRTRTSWSAMTAHLLADGRLHHLG
jgi:uncharacterized membrane protein (UPF0182 family)